MNEKWIILKMLDISDYLTGDIEYIMDIAVVNESGKLLVFKSLKDARKYQDSLGYDGKCVELPIY